MVETLMSACILAVSRAPRHEFSKRNELSIRLVAGRGVEGDAHFGETVKHRHQAARDPLAPNLRQVHLIQSELFEELRGKGFAIAPGDMGENIATRGIDLLAAPRGARLRLGDTAIVELTGLRQPCVLIDRFRPGLKAAVLDRDASGEPIRKAGVMAIVIADGDVRPGDPIVIETPAEPWIALAPV